MSGRDGPPVIKTLIRVSDLNDAFEWTAHEQHVRRIRDAAPPLTDEQATAIRKVLMDHLRERDAMRRRRPGEPGSST
ncbi:MAG: hypothetical protein L0H71_04335 [Yaniella sp.]|uniref:hypothetical protein n=1 Tax=Yaniella sp. TaxID=2773929 RepID=UPI002648D5CE|nr:hypothetical protein [Yaniella sp.]MDN5741930.1 hypothetical protein [Yaniella sp.]MDN5817381.1 hypothetical protein [Yaniella sp.]MDN5911903.1 hypothetical protein [Yaniella sp.]MDN6636862.1 hypothetical protein [Yaniella sp.]MDN6758215.1 hypothetical protein [Yaniella sp.]